MREKRLKIKNRYTGFEVRRKLPDDFSTTTNTVLTCGVRRVMLFTAAHLNNTPTFLAVRFVGGWLTDTE